MSYQVSAIRPGARRIAIAPPAASGPNGPCPQPMVAAGFLLAAQFTYNIKNGPIYAAVQNIVPSHMRATGAAMHMLAATTVGSIVGPTLAGFLSDTFAHQA